MVAFGPRYSERTRCAWRQPMTIPPQVELNPGLLFLVFALLAISSLVALERYVMNNVWIAILAAQKSAAGTKPANRCYCFFQIFGGIGLALLIGSALLIAAAFNG